MAKKGGKLRTVYGVFFALLTLFLGGLFIRQVWSIYRSAPESPYTTANISKHFKEISLVVWVWLGGLLVNILLALVFPSKDKRVKATVDEKKTLSKVKAKVPTEGEAFEKAYALSKRKKGFRVFVTLFATVFMLAAATLCALTLFDIYYRPIFSTDFDPKSNTYEAADKITQVALVALVALAIASIAALLLSKSRKKEQKGYLKIIAESKKAPQEAPIEEAPVVEEALVEEVPVAEQETPVEEVPIEEKKRSPWAAVIRKIVGMLFLEEKHTQEEIDEDILRVMQGQEEKKLGISIPAPLLEEAPVQKAEVEKPKKVKKTKPPKKPLVKEKKAKKSRKKGKRAGVILLRVALAAAGVALVVLGIFNGGMKDVLLKAINICTQCIGLG